MTINLWLRWKAQGFFLLGKDFNFQVKAHTNMKIIIVFANFRISITGQPQTTMKKSVFTNSWKWECLHFSCTNYYFKYRNIGIFGDISHLLFPYMKHLPHDQLKSEFLPIYLCKRSLCHHSEQPNFALTSVEENKRIQITEPYKRMQTI